MACNGCAKKFSLFRTEHACPNCGFGFCKSCLEHLLFVEKLSNKAKVCTKCKFAIEKGNPSGRTTFELPKAYLKRIENISDDNKVPIVVYKSGDRFERLKKGLSVEDQVIVERLEKLREDRKSGSPLPSDDDIRDRLAKLRGVPEISSNKSSTPAVDLRSDQQKCDDLVMQYLEECDLDEIKENENKDLEERLNRLKDLPPGVSNVPKVNPTEDLTEEELAAKLVKQIISEPDLIDEEQSYKTSDDEHDSIKTSDSDELSPEDDDSDSSDGEHKKKKKH